MAQQTTITLQFTTSITSIKTLTQCKYRKHTTLEQAATKKTKEMKLLNSKTALKKYLKDKETKHQAIMVEDPGRESLCRSLMIMAHRF